MLRLPTPEYCFCFAKDYATTMAELLNTNGLPCLNMNFIEIERALLVEAGLVEEFGSGGFLPRTTLSRAGFLLWRVHVLLHDALHTRSVDWLVLWWKRLRLPMVMVMIDSGIVQVWIMIVV